MKSRKYLIYNVTSDWSNLLCHPSNQKGPRCHYVIITSSYKVKLMTSWDKCIFGSQNKSQKRATLNLKLSNELFFEAKSGTEIHFNRKNYSSNNNLGTRHIQYSSRRFTF